MFVNTVDYNKLTFSAMSQSLSCRLDDLWNSGLGIYPFTAPCLCHWSLWPLQFEMGVQSIFKKHATHFVTNYTWINRDSSAPL